MPRRISEYRHLEARGISTSAPKDLRNTGIQPTREYYFQIRTASLGKFCANLNRRYPETSKNYTTRRLDDRELIIKIRQPDSRQYGFNLLVRKYQQRVYGLIRRMVIDHDDADDLVQEVFIRVWQNIDRFRGDSGLYTWIYRIAANESLNFLRKKRRRLFLPIGNIESELSHSLTHSDYIDGDEIQVKLQKAILKLPDKQRLVFNMKYFEELSYEDISGITGTSEGALKASYHHAVKKIEHYLTRG